MEYIVVRYFCFENGRRGWMKLRPTDVAAKHFEHDIVDFFNATRYELNDEGKSQAKNDIAKFVELTELPAENFKMHRIKVTHCEELE